MNKKAREVQEKAKHRIKSKTSGAIITKRKINRKSNTNSKILLSE